MAHIDIRSTGEYHPKHQVANEHFIEHFKKQGKDIRHMLLSYGRRTRYLSDRKNENSMTMAAEACKKALESADLTGNDIDLLIFSSATPEYLAPANSIKIHQIIGGRNNTIAYDMNVNCVGMMVAIEQASRVMLSSNDCTHAIIVGSEQMNKYSKRTDEYTLSSFGDAACAVILVKSQGDESGFQDAMYHTDSLHSSTMLFPECGMSNIYDPHVRESDKRIFWSGGDGSNGFKLAAYLIQSLLERNHRNINDIKRFFISQVSFTNIQNLALALSVDLEMFEFVGDSYGYTGTSSPFLALHHAIEKEKIQRGDDVIFWSIGTGYESCAMLWKY